MTQGTNTTESYTYDLVGNRLSNLAASGWTYNSSNELTFRPVGGPPPTGAYTYDYNGNTTVDTTRSTTYAWDFENRLTSVTLPGSGGTVSFKYDPFGRRTYKSSSAGTSIYTYDGDNLIEETNAAGAVVARYSQGLNIDEPLAMLRSAATSYYHADGLGSVTSLSNAAGTLAQTYKFDSFGKQTASSGSLTNPFQYTARESDTETGLYYYRARYYDPAIGRFLAEDPIRFRADNNFYSYVHNRALDMRDPLGRLAFGGGLTVGIMGGIFGFGGGAEGSCLLVGDTAGNSGVLCCSGYGGGWVVGGGATGQATSVVCPTCETICDMEGDSIQVAGFGGAGAGTAISGGASINMTQAAIFASGGGAMGAGYGIVGLKTSCKLRIGGKGCRKCQATKK